MTAQGFRGLERPHAACARCGVRFDGPAGPAEAFATLRIESGEVVREDLCPACFGGAEPRPRPFWRRPLLPAGREDGAGAGGPAPGRRRRRAADLLERLFDGLADADPPAPPRAAGPLEASPGDAEPAADRVEPAPVDGAAADAPAPHAPAPGAASGAAPDDGPKLRYLAALALVRARRFELVSVESAAARGDERLRLRRAGQDEVVEVRAPRIAESDLARLTRSLARELGEGER